MPKQDKHTPSDNRQQKSQNQNMSKTSNPKTSGDNLNDIEKEAFTSRESGKNESGKYNDPRRGTGDQGGGEQDKSR